jgi:hypothetical protein
VAVSSRGFVVLYPKHFVGQALPTRLQPTPHMMFLFVSSQFSLKDPLLVLAASFEPFLADYPLPFASSYRLITSKSSTVIFLQRTYTALVNTHVGRTQFWQTDILKRRFAAKNAASKGVILLKPPLSVYCQVHFVTASPIFCHYYHLE